MDQPRIDVVRTLDLAGHKAPDQRAKATKAAQQFEQMFIQMMVENLRKSGDFAGAEGGGMFGDGPGSDTYSQWFDTQMAADLGRGGSFGIADSILRDMERHGEIPKAPPKARPAAAPATRPTGGIDVDA